MCDRVILAARLESAKWSGLERNELAHGMLWMAAGVTPREEPAWVLMQGSRPVPPLDQSREGTSRPMRYRRKRQTSTATPAESGELHGYWLERHINGEARVQVEGTGKPPHSK